MGLSTPAWGRLWKNELQTDSVMLKKINYSNPALEARQNWNNKMISI